MRDFKTNPWLTKRITLAPIIIASAYFLFASIWIFLSDSFVDATISDHAMLTTVQTYKGWGFVAVTSLLLYLLLYIFLKLLIRYILAHQQAESALDETTRQYRTLVENLNGMVYRCRGGPGWEMEYASPGALTLTGYEPEQFTGPDAVRYGDLIHPDDRQTVRDTIQAAIEQQTPFDFVYRLQTAGGQTKWVSEQGQPIFTNTGQLKSLEGFITDVTQQQQARVALQESEILYRSMFEEHPAVMLLIDPHSGAIVDANPAAAAFYGWSRSELRQMNINQINILPPDEIRAEMERTRALNEYRFIYQHRLADGSIRDVETVGGPIQRQGKTVLFSIIHDITERKRAQEALRESLENMAEAQRIAHFGSWEIRLTPGLEFVEPQFWSDECYRIFGYEPGTIKITKEVFYDHVHPDDREFALQALSNAIRERTEATYEYRIVQPGGAIRHVCDQIRVVVDEDTGKPIKIVGTVNDITERRQAEQALRESEASLRQSQRVAHVGHWSWDTMTNRVVWSDEMKRIFGLDPDKFAGDLDQIIAQRIHPEDREKVLASNQTVLTEQQPEPLEYRLLLPDQSVRTVMAIPSERVTDEHGNITTLSGVVQDITKRKQLEEENQRLAAQFHQAQRLDALGKLAGGVAHDFNNLLVPIIGYAQLGMMNLKPNDPLYANFSHINNAAERAANLVRQILAFSRRQILEMKSLNLNDVITDFEKMLSRLLRESISLQVHLSPQVQLVRADQGQIEQVLMNLAVNARDAMPSGGILTIETGLESLDEAYTAQHPGAEPGLYVLLAVSDTGQGMDAETKQRIFEPFFTTKARSHGTGLGLATVFGIIKQHQGNIWVYSEPGQGTTFKIFLPVIEDQVDSDAPQPKIAISQLNGSETVLVVEDEDAVRQLVVHTLQQHGYQVLATSSPTEALELVAAASESLDMVLTDVVMPEMNGRQLYAELTQLRPNLKVLYISGYTDNVIVHHGALDPQVNFLAKPFSMHGLLRKMKEVLAQPNT